jgi:hypothetical protein
LCGAAYNQDNKRDFKKIENAGRAQKLQKTEDALKEMFRRKTGHFVFLVF